MLSQNSTAHSPSFSRTWSLPVPALSSPQIVIWPLSSRLPKYFQPVGVSKQGMPSAAATRSSAALVGIERATPFNPLAYPGTWWALAAKTARLSLGVTMKRRPRIRLRSPSPSLAAPKLGASGVSGTNIAAISSVA